MTNLDLSFIHRFVPATDVGSARTLLLLHGTGGDEDDLLDIGRTLDPSANILSPRGKVLENGMNRFFKRFPDGTFDLEDVRVRTQELAAFVHEAAAHYGFDVERVTAVGYSNGANIAAALLLLKPTTLAAAVLLRGMLPLTPESPPDLRGKRVLTLAGTDDTMIPRAGTESLIRLLRECGADVRDVWQPAAHRLIAEDIEEAKAFMREMS